MQIPFKNMCCVVVSCVVHACFCVQKLQDFLCQSMHFLLYDLEIVLYVVYMYAPNPFLCARCALLHIFLLLSTCGETIGNLSDWDVVCTHTNRFYKKESKICYFDVA